MGNRRGAGAVEAAMGNRRGVGAVEAAMGNRRRRIQMGRGDERRGEKGMVALHKGSKVKEAGRRMAA
jgi:hypothetical protein